MGERRCYFIMLNDTKWTLPSYVCEKSSYCRNKINDNEECGTVDKPDLHIAKTQGFTKKGLVYLCDYLSTGVQPNTTDGITFLIKTAEVLEVFQVVQCNDENIHGFVEDWCSLEGDSRMTKLHTALPIGGWDVSAVTDMEILFCDMANFNEDLSKWNVSKVTTMESMFRGAHAFNQPLGKWKVSKVKAMEHMFRGACAFNQPLNKWKVSNVTTMKSMFHGAEAFNQPLDKWKVSKVTTMEGMFQGAHAFNQPLGKWNVSNVTTMDHMFQEAHAFNQDLSDWKVSSNCGNRLMFYGARQFKDEHSPVWRGR